MNGGMIRQVEVVDLAQHTKWLEYVTSQGDTFDSLAMDLYDDECLSSEIIAENPFYADVLIFEAGVTLYLPVIENLEDASSKPPWEQGDDVT